METYTNNSFKQSNDLDQYILEQILLFLPYEEVCRSELVCKHWGMVASSEHVWNSLRAIYFGERGTIGINSAISTQNRWKQVFMLFNKTKAKGYPLKNVTVGKKNDKEDLKLKIMVVGDASVGKTSLLIVDSTSSFSQDNIPPLADNYNTKRMIDGRVYTAVMWDLNAQETYSRIRSLSYPCTSTFLILFAVNCRDSFDNVKLNWIRELRYYMPSTPYILVGTKIDLRINEECITAKEGLKLAKGIGASGYFEISCQNKDGIKELIDFAIQVARHHELVTHLPKKSRNGACRNQ